MLKQFIHWLRAIFSGDQAETDARAKRMAWVPIRELSVRHRPRIEKHLLSLSSDDRYLRFGYSATDAQIRMYVDKLNFVRDEIFGVFNRRLELVAMAHLAYSVDPKWTSCGEFGVSVAAKQRGRGLGQQLFARAVRHAQNEGVRMMFIHALSENAAMLKIARNAGARVERDGSESEAYLSLPPATMDSRWNEVLDEHMAELDYQLKLQASQFRKWIGMRSKEETAERK